MSEIKIGDIVARRSYSCDIFFKVTDISEGEGERNFTLKGISYRIEADAPESDLEIQTDNAVRTYKDNTFRTAERYVAKARNRNDAMVRYYIPRYRGCPKKVNRRDTTADKSEVIKKPGKVLHIDGDKDYMENCLNEYNSLGITAIGRHIPEKNQADGVVSLLSEHKPDILVLTGHDGLLRNKDSYANPESYRNSRYFVAAVKEAREYDRDMDRLVIFAGACQSLYNEIIKAGANFASAPSRDLIHALDPVKVCQKVALTGIDKVLTAQEVINNTITGKTGIGGLQTRGKYREGFPVDKYQPT